MLFLQKMYDSFGKLSLDDLERIAQEALRENSGEELPDVNENKLL